MNTPLIKKLSHQKATGTGRKTLSLEETRKFPFMLAPLPEQYRIVAKIEELFTKLDAGVESLKNVQAQLKRYRQSVLKAAVEGKLTAEWREQHLPASANSAQTGKDKLEPADKLLEHAQNEHISNLEKEYNEITPIDISSLHKLPKSWKWTDFNQIGELNRGKSKHRPRNDPKLYNGKYPFVQTGDIRNSNKFIMGYSQTYNEIGLKQSRLWPKGTLCITIAANIADTAILDFDACFPDSIVGFTPNQYCNIFYVEYFMRTAKKNLDRYAPATAQKNINLKILKELLIPLPSKTEQDVIVNNLDRLFSISDKIDSIINIELKRAQSLRQSILKHAFEGRLVPQDLNDLPAPRPGKYFIYVLECSNGSHYISHTENIEKRWCDHAGGRGADWTKKYPPLALVHWEEYNTRADSAKREKELKTGFGRKWIKREIKAGRARQAGEPASLLLERIKAEKAKQKKSKQMEMF